MLKTLKETIEIDEEAEEATTLEVVEAVGDAEDNSSSFFLIRVCQV